MERKEAYQRLKQFVLNNGYTSEQILNVSKETAGQLINRDLSNFTAFNGLKKKLAAFVKDAENATEFQLIKQRLIDAGIKTLLPDVEFDRAGLWEDRHIMIWPVGKPEDGGT